MRRAIACLRMYSIWPLTLRNSSCAQASMSAQSAGSIRKRKDLRGSMTGTIVSLQLDGRVVWQTDSGAELIALPEALLREKGS